MKPKDSKDLQNETIEILIFSTPRICICLENEWFLHRPLEGVPNILALFSCVARFRTKNYRNGKARMRVTLVSPALGRITLLGRITYAIKK